MVCSPSIGEEKNDNPLRSDVFEQFLQYVIWDVSTLCVFE